MKQNQQDTQTQVSTLPPHSVDAENAVLGAMILDPGCIAEVAGLIRPQDFYIVRNEYVCDAILSLWREQSGVDYLTIVERLRERGQLDEVGGAAYVTYLFNSVPSAREALTYAAFVQRLADRRRLVGLASDLAQAAHDETKTVMSVYADFMHQAVNAKPRALNKALTLGSSVTDRFLALQGRSVDDGDAVTIFPLPFGSASDDGLPFMTGGKMFGIGGDEKTGKSALAETLSEHWAKLGLHGFYIHTEEKPDAKILRRFSRWSGIPFLRLEAGSLGQSNIEARELAMTITGEWEANLNLWYESLPTADSVLTLFRRAVEVFQAQFVVLDNFTDVIFEVARNGSKAEEAIRLLQRIDDVCAQYGILAVIVTQMSTQESGKRIAYGTSGFNKKMTWFWDINRKALKGTLTYRADGNLYTVEPGEFDPRVDIYVPASRYGRGVSIPVFADLRRFYWRPRTQVEVVSFEPQDGSVT